MYYLKLTSIINEHFSLRKNITKFEKFDRGLKSGRN